MALISFKNGSSNCESGLNFLPSKSPTDRQRFPSERVADPPAPGDESPHFQPIARLFCRSWLPGMQHPPGQCLAQHPYGGRAGPDPLRSGFPLCAEVQSGTAHLSNSRGAVLRLHARARSGTAIKAAAFPAAVTLLIACPALCHSLPFLVTRCRTFQSRQAVIDNIEESLRADGEAATCTCAKMSELV